MTRSDGQVKRTKPELWESCKKEAEKKIGLQSSRSMQLAAKLYKEKGGGYFGLNEKNSSTTLWEKNQNKKEDKKKNA